MAMIAYPDGSEVKLFDRIVDDEGASGLVIGTSENVDFLVSSGANVLHPQSGAALIMRDNGELKWRPFPGNTLTCRARSTDCDRDMTEVRGVWGARIPVVPPPFDYYCSMDPIKLGDLVYHTPDKQGTVVAVFSQGAFAANLQPADWETTGHGFLVESMDDKGLYLYVDANEDISLVRRSA